MKNILRFLALLCLPLFAHAQTIEFSDDFESGTGNWVLEGTWGLTTAQSNSPTNSLTDSPGANYAANLNISATMATGVDLSAALDANLTFSAIYDIEGGNFDYCYVEASSDGTNWINIATFLGEGNLTPWVEYSYSLGGFVGNSDVKVRFRLFTDGGYEVDGIYIDDVVITSSDQDNSAPFVLHEGPDFYESAAGDVVFTATITDISGIATNTLFYSVDGGPASSTMGVLEGDDVYSYTVPAQEAGAQVDYFLEVTDGSANANVATTSTFSYIAGNHIFYDNATVNFVNVFGPAAQSNLTGCAVRFSTFGAELKYALIRNYTDVNRPNDDFEFHIWADDGGLPGADIITPFMVTPEATLDNNSPMTRVDLRPYSAELSMVEGDVFVGFVVPDGETWLVQTTPAIGNRTYAFNGTDWAQIDDDYHFRIVTEAVTGADDCADATDLNGLLGGAVGTTLSSPLFDNTDATVGGEPEDGFECFFPDGNGGELENTQWYTFVGDGNAYSITTGDCDATNYITDGDTQIAIYSGDDCGNLTPVACNEDEDFEANLFNALVNLQTEEGVTYYIMIDGWNGATGEYCVQFTQVSLVTCDDIALGDASTDAPLVCLGATTSFTLDAGTVVPELSGTNGFRWVVTSADISGSADPGGEASYLGAFGETQVPYEPALLNDGSQLPAGAYYFTPVVYGGASGTWPALDYSAGCVLTGNSILIELLPALDALVPTETIQDEVIPPGDNGEINVSVTGGSGSFSYEWSNGETTATISGLAAGDYTVTITDDSGCVDPVEMTYTVDMIVGVDDVAFTTSLELAPNPAKDQVLISYSFVDQSNLQLQVTNSIGQVVHQQTAPRGQRVNLVLDVQSYPNGVYFLQFNDGEKQVTRRLVVSK